MAIGIGLFLLLCVLCYLKGLLYTSVTWGEKSRTGTAVKEREVVLQSFKDAKKKKRKKETMIGGQAAKGGAVAGQTRSKLAICFVCKGRRKKDNGNVVCVWKRSRNRNVKGGDEKKKNKKRKRKVKVEERDGRVRCRNRTR